MQCIKEKAVATVPLAPPLKNGLPFAPTCIPNKEVFSDLLQITMGRVVQTWITRGFFFFCSKHFLG